MGERTPSLMLVFSPFGNWIVKAFFKNTKNWQLIKMAFWVFGGHCLAVAVVRKHPWHTLLEVIPYWLESQL